MRTSFSHFPFTLPFSIQHSTFSIARIHHEWLFKEEPTNYSYDALVRDGRPRGPACAIRSRRSTCAAVAKGDRIFFYHTGSEKSVVGIMKAAGAAYPDPADKTGKLYAVDVVPVKKLARPVTLAAIKADKAFATFPLVQALEAVGDAGQRAGVGEDRENVGRCSCIRSVRLQQT